MPRPWRAAAVVCCAGGRRGWRVFSFFVFVATPSVSPSLTQHALHIVPRVRHVKLGAGQQGVGEGVVEFAEVVEDL